MRRRGRRVGTLALAGILGTTALTGQVWPAGAATGGTVGEARLPIPDVTPIGLATGASGAVWFAENSGSAIGKVDSAGGVHEYPLPANSSKTLGGGEGMATAANGTVWFTDPASDVPRVGKVNQTTGKATLYEVPLTGDVNFAGDQITDITAGPDGAMWFAGNGAGGVGRIDSKGKITAFATPGLSPYAITTGPDKALWFTDTASGGIGRLDPATGNVTSYYPPSAGNGSPFGGSIANGPDKALWFTEPAANMIGRIDPATGDITEYPVPTGSSAPQGITAGPDGALWFTEAAASNIGRIDPATGAITEYPLPTSLSVPMRIISGPKGDLWFTESGKGAIGHLSPAAPPTGAPHPATPPSGPGFPTIAAPFENQCALNQICQTQVTTGGSVKIGSFSQALPPGAIRVTGFIQAPITTNSLLHAPVTGSQLVSVPVTVAGGLIGQLPLVGKILGMTPVAMLPFNKLTITQSLAGPVYVNPFTSAATTKLNVHLNNQLLGTACTIGPLNVSLAPQDLYGGTLKDPETNWQAGPISINDVIAVPAATGCGPGGILDGVINQLMGLPSTSAGNTIALTGVLSLGLGINPASSAALRKAPALPPALARLLPHRPAKG